MCPFCKTGRVIKTSSCAGEEIYCSDCLRVLKSASLRFSYKSTDFAGEVNECSEGGLPGYRGSGKKAKCHVYQPGDDAGEEKAKQKARQSSYTTLKRSHIEKLIHEGAFGGFDTTKMDEFATTNDSNYGNHFGPSEEAPANSPTTGMSKDGVWIQLPGDNVNNGPESSAY